MAFQKQVYGEPARGVAGQRYGGNPAAHYVPTPLAGQNGVTAGRFVWRDAADTSGHTVVCHGTGAPIGVAQREKTVPLSCLDSATMLIPSGWRVPVVIRGDLMLASSTAVTPGQKVFANLATGEVSTADAGATVAGSIETQFEAREGAAAGEPFLASSITPAA